MTELWNLKEWIATSVCTQSEKEGIVTVGLRKRLFTVCAQDNIDQTLLQPLL